MTNQCQKKDLCGSCELSDFSYEQQLQKKLLAINMLLSDHGVICKNILSSPKTSHYRNKMDFVIDFQRRVGLREKGKWWKVIDDHTCFISDEHIENLFKVCRAWVQSSTLSCWDRKAYTGLLRYVVVRTNLAGESMVVIVTSSPASDDEKNLLIDQLQKLSQLCLSEDSQFKTLVWSINETTSDVSYGTILEPIFGDGFIFETINDISYKISPNAFFQTNSYTASILQNIVADYIKSCPVPSKKSTDHDISSSEGTISLEKQYQAPKLILDLYCGSGFFSLAAAKQGMKTLGIEVSDEAIISAKENASYNSISADMCEFRAESAESLSWETYVTSDTVVIVDPTRAGLHTDVVKTLLKCQPQEIVYVSCNYRQFSSELPRFLEKYKVADCVAIDQFPQTNHVELVTRLVKN